MATTTLKKPAAKKTATNTITIAKTDLKHKHAQVLLWVAQGLPVEVRLIGTNRFGLLDTSQNFSIFGNAEYRLKELEPCNKRFLMRDTLLDTIQLTEKKYRNEAEMRKETGFTAPRHKVISVHEQNDQ